VHARRDYPKKIIFWYLGKPEELIDNIRQAGFLPGAPASSEVQWQGIPLRWTAILFIFLTWNGMFYVGDFFSRHFRTSPGLIALLPLIGAVLFCWGAKRSPSIQKIILREGHSVNQIKPYLSLTQTVCAILLAVFSILTLTHSLK
jgi:hypothetical protein